MWASEKVFNISFEACIEAKKRNITIACDLIYKVKLWSKDEAREVMTELCSYDDVCIANAEDAKNVFGIEAEKTDVYSR